MMSEVRNEGNNVLKDESPVTSHVLEENLEDDAGTQDMV